MAGWRTVEKWQASSEIGPLELHLLRAEGAYSQAWRVESAGPTGRAKPATFTGNDREQRARTELDRRKTRYPRVWQQVIDSEALR